MHVQGFEFEYIPQQKSVNMFEKMEVADTIYGGVVEPTRTDANCVGHIKKTRGEAASSKITLIQVNYLAITIKGM